MSWYVPVVAVVGLAVYAGAAVALAAHHDLRAAYRDLRVRRPTPEDFTTLLEACIDYRKAMARAFVPDATSGAKSIDEICKRYGVVLEPRSLNGERPGKL